MDFNSGILVAVCFWSLQYNKVYCNTKIENLLTSVKNGIVIYRIDNNTGQKILVPIITDKISVDDI